jgi:hypothetical protein
MMNRYVIPQQFGDDEIMPTKIIMQSYAGAPVENDSSPGGFFVDLILIIGSVPNPISKKRVRVEHPTSQPEDVTNVESIKAWAVARLNEQYGIEE